ncbi:hypothetical protein SAMN05216227_102067 [Pseudorhodobacter antarcticus]|jgi:hypothetical protein|uniref:Uncharacterized protein n=1 Tax=Pseudorhodobacter antarcticus TaxID=1077947 RepID=A0A1H8IJ47_9RHOB|nr:hypothetical protein [Pseudorhodobacter antarcticus]SEN68753.1 hypothetical protein SAMN05216227_102067 [Pseudorhodobacter antarcticus]
MNNTPGYDRLRLMITAAEFTSRVVYRRWSDVLAKFGMTVEYHNDNVAVIYCTDTRAKHPACITLSTSTLGGSASAQMTCHYGDTLVQLFEQGADDSEELATISPEYANRVQTKGRVLRV